MATRVRKDQAMVYANIGVHAHVEVTLAMDRDGGETAAIHSVTAAQT